MPALSWSGVEEFEAEAAGRGYHVELDVDGARGVIAADRAALLTALHTFHLDGPATVSNGT